MAINMSSYEGDPISIDLPDTVVMEVIEADAVVKGQPRHRPANQLFWRMV